MSVLAPRNQWQWVTSNSVSWKRCSKSERCPKSRFTAVWSPGYCVRNHMQGDHFLLPTFPPNKENKSIWQNKELPQMKTCWKKGSIILNFWVPQRKKKIYMRFKRKSSLFRERFSFYLLSQQWEYILSKFQLLPISILGSLWERHINTD